jgi:hypothetical protein
MIIVSVGSSALSTVRLNMKQYGISLVLGAISMPITVLIRLILDDFILKFLHVHGAKVKHPALGFQVTISVNSLASLR